MAGRKLIEEALPIWSTAPQNWTSAASTGDYISMKGYQSVMFIIQTGAWAAGTAAVTVNEATDVGATGAQALTFLEYWTNSATAASANMVRTVCASTFNIINQANTLYAIEITADTLTTNTNYDCISLAIATPGANADFYSAVALGFRTRYQRDTATMIDAIAD